MALCTIVHGRYWYTKVLWLTLVVTNQRAGCGVLLEGSVDMADARRRLGADQAVQGNMDPVTLFAGQDFITKKVHDTIEKAGNRKHVMNLGHGVMVGTPEENVAHFFKTVQDYRY